MLVPHDDAQREIRTDARMSSHDPKRMFVPRWRLRKTKYQLRKVADGINSIQLQRDVSAALSPQAQSERDPARPGDDQIEGKEEAENVKT